MTRRFLPACLLLLIGLATAPACRAQTAFPREVVPPRSALERLGLQRAWFAAIPLGTPRERVIVVSMAEDMIFAQTNAGNFFVFDAETGRFRWSANLGPATLEAHRASVNSFGVFVANGYTLLALDRRSGNLLWKSPLNSLSTSDTGANEERVLVGTNNGKVTAFRARDVKSSGRGTQGYSLQGGSPAWTWQTNAKVTSRPIPAGQVAAFASNDGKVYVAVDEPYSILYRWASNGPIVASMGTHGTRTLLVPSTDNSLHALDLYNGDLLWSFPSGAPITQEPLVGEDDVYLLNTKGMMSALNVKDGTARWTHSSGASKLLAVGAKRVYAQSLDNDLIILDRATGRMLFDARATHQRAGLNLRDYSLAPANRVNDRIYFATPSGLLVGLREADAIEPRPVRKPGQPAFGYIPPSGSTDTPPPAANAVPPVTVPTGEKPAATKPDDQAMPDDEAAADDAPAPKPKPKAKAMKGKAKGKAKVMADDAMGDDPPADDAMGDDADMTKPKPKRKKK